MSQLSRSSLTTDINSNIYNNTNREISGLDVGDRMINIIDSLVSRNGDDNITGILRYSAAHSVSNAYDLVHKTYVDALISNTAYDATSWNGVTGIAPSKDAVRDIIESISSSKWDITGNTLAARGKFGSTSGAFGWDDYVNNVIIRGVADSGEQQYWGRSSGYASTSYSFESYGNDNTTYHTSWKNDDSTELFAIRDDGRLIIPVSFKLGIYGSNSETGGGLAYIIGNSVIADTTTDNQLIKTSGDNGIWLRMLYNAGISFHTGLSGATNTTASDDSNMRMLIDNSGLVTVYGTDGIVIPKGTTAERNTIQSIIRYNTTTGKFEGYDGTNWHDFH